MTAKIPSDSPNNDRDPRYPTETQGGGSWVGSARVIPSRGDQPLAQVHLENHNPGYRLGYRFHASRTQTKGPSLNGHR
jgi:hypothetical protein